MSEPIPSKSLLPPYLGHQVWQDLADAMDQLLLENVQPINEVLKNIRAVYAGSTDYDPYSDTNSALASKIQARQLLSPEDFDTFSSDLEAQRLATLGLSLSDPRAAADDALRRLVQNIGQYWYHKGTAELPDFISYCLNSPVRLVPLWTTNYRDFFEMGPQVGTPVWEGGTWYPTTHVRLYFDTLRFNGDNFESLIRILNDLINYNLVIEAFITQDYLVTSSANNPTVEPYPDLGRDTVPWPMPVLKLGLYETINETIFPF